MPLDVSGVKARAYAETLFFLDNKGWSFADLKSVIAMVAFIYDKTDSEIRADIWAIHKCQTPDTKKEPR